MKTDYRIDYRSQTAAHFTTFPQTEQSARALARNRQKLSSIADETRATISSQATQKLRNSILGVNINLFS